MSISGKLRRGYEWMRGKLSSVGSTDSMGSLAAYRQLALQISKFNPGRGSALLATPTSSDAVAQSCVTFARSLAAVLPRPVLLADLSGEGQDVPNMLGITDEMYSSPEARSRFFCLSGGWYISTREGVPVGPFDSLHAASTGLSEFIAAPGWIKNVHSAKLTIDQSILPTAFQNLFFLPSEPSRQAIVRGIYLERPRETTTELLSALHEQFSYLLFYGGSVIGNPMLLAVAGHVETVLHAAVESETKVSDLVAAQETLQSYRQEPVPYILVKRNRRRRRKSSPLEQSRA